MANPAQRRVVEALVREALRHLDDDRLQAAQQCIDAAAGASPQAAGVRFARAQLYRAQGRAALATAELQAACKSSPAHADAQYALGCVHEDAGEHRAMVSRFIAVLRLDAAADRRDRVGTAADRAEVERTAARVLGTLPDRLCERLAIVPIQLASRPSEALVRDGFDPRALGLFEGPCAGDAARFNHIALGPARIVLFYANLLAASEDAESLAQQVEVTLLHEIGHFFGLDEDGVAALGLA